MRGTKKIPLDNLLKIHSDVMDKFTKSQPKHIHDLNIGILKKTNLNKIISKEIYPDYRDHSWFTRFETGLSKAQDLLAKYWVFTDINQSILEKLYYYAYQTKLTNEKVNELIELYQLNKVSIGNTFLKDLEINQNNVEVNCISSDLKWLVHNIDEIIESPVKNTFKYIAVSPKADINIPILRHKIQESGCENILIKKSYDDNFLKHNRNDIIFLPVIQDIIIYKNIPLGTQDLYNVPEKIIVSRPTVFEENHCRIKEDLIYFEKSKLFFVETWFNSTWRKLT